MKYIRCIYRKQVNNGMIFLKRELSDVAAEEANRAGEVNICKAKLSGKRTGKRTVF